MITILMVFAIIALILFLSIHQSKAPLVNVLRYGITAIVAFGIVLLGISTYHGSGSYGSFGYERPNQTLGILIFAWALFVAFSPVVGKIYNKPKLSIVVLILGTLSLLLIPAFQFLTL